MSGRGGAREGAGRPKQTEIRKQRQLRAYDDEWRAIQQFAKLFKHGDRAACEKFLAEHAKQ